MDIVHNAGLFREVVGGSADAALSLGGIDVLAPALLSCALVFPLDVNHLTVVFIQLLVWVPVFQFKAAGLGTHTLCSCSFFFHSVQGQKTQKPIITNFLCHIESRPISVFTACLAKYQQLKNKPFSLVYAHHFC